MFKYCLLFALFAFANLTATAQGGIIVNVGSLTLAPGGTGFVNVSITGDGGPTDLFNLFQLELNIAPLGNPRRLEFIDPQSTAYVSDADYIFLANSGGPFIDPPPPPNPIITLLVGDFAADGSDVLVGTTSLLARLAVTTNTALPSMEGDEFVISIVSGANTYFDSTTANNISFTFNSGTVTITSPPPVTTVPEPNTALIFCLGCATLVFSRKRFHQAVAFRSLSQN